MDFGDCWWMWDGDEWQEVDQSCDPGKVCSEPSFEGTFVGETAETPCG